MSSFNNFGVEKGVTIRYPATANLMIDSADAVVDNPWKISINRNQSIQNGYFTRIATTEVVLDWCIPNIEDPFNYLIFDISGTTSVANDIEITLPTGFYTMEQALDAIVALLNVEGQSTGSSFSVNVNNNICSIDISGGKFAVSTPSPLSDSLGILELPTPVPPIPPPIPPAIPLSVTLGGSVFFNNCASVQRYRYIDFTSNSLTYCQDLKDNSTATYNRDVLCRWYMAFDEEPDYDGYGFPILMGYKKFILRRLFNPPKYIKWDNNAPIGSLVFEVYGDDGNLLEEPDPSSFRSSWLMTLQLSEN